MWGPNCTDSGGVFLVAIGADETQFEASFRAAISTANEQKSVSLAKQADETCAEYRRQKASESGGTWIPATSLVAFFGRFDNIDRCGLTSLF